MDEGHTRDVEREKIRTRLDEIGYSKERNHLEAYTDRHALIKPHESKWWVIIDLVDGHEFGSYSGRPSAMESFTLVAERDREERAARDDG